MRRHDYDLTKTFEVLVGKAPDQKRFTVYHDLLTQSSEFFKAARSSHWTQPDQPTILVDHDPETFSTHLHCLYFGVDAIKDRLSLVAEQHGSTTETAVNNDENDTESSSDSDSDSDSASDEGQNEQQNTETTTQKCTKTLTVPVDGKEKEAAAILFVGNLSYTTEEKALEQAFEEFGEIRGVRIVTSSKDGRSKGFGYVEFASAESAANALQARSGFELDGRGLRLDFAKPRPGAANVSVQDHQGNMALQHTDIEIYVSNGMVDDSASTVNFSQNVKDEVLTIDYNTNYNEENDDVEDAKIRVLIKLYVLADKLIDLHAANLVIDEMIHLADTFEHLPGSTFTNVVYECTPTGSPLRVLFRDWHLHECHYAWCQDLSPQEESLPVEFLKDLVIETGRIQSKNRNRTINDVFRTRAISRPAGHYHQKPGPGRSQSDNGA
jgi:RNA recognition motif-containing protein